MSGAIFRGGKVMAVIYPPKDNEEEKDPRVLVGYLGTLLGAFPNSIGILHQPEPKPQEDEDKRHHLHVYIEGETLNGHEWIQTIADLLKVPPVQVSVRAIKNDIGALRYLLHLDNPEKIRYEEGDVKTKSHDLLSRFRKACAKAPEVGIDEILACPNKEAIARLVGVSKYSSAVRIWCDVRDEREFRDYADERIANVLTQVNVIYEELAAQTANPKYLRSGAIPLKDFTEILMSTNDKLRNIIEFLKKHDCEEGEK